MGKHHNRRERIAKLRDVIFDKMACAIPKVKMASVAGGRYDVGQVTYKLTIDLTFDRDFEKKLFAASNGKGVSHFIEYCAQRGFADFFADDDDASDAEMTTTHSVDLRDGKANGQN